MVVEKRSHYGFNGYEVPAMPRASRSVRRRRFFKRKVEDNHMYAFDLLATVAGELLEEKGSSAAPSSASAKKAGCTIREDTVKQEKQDGQYSFKPEPCDQGSCDESASVFAPGSRHTNKNSFKEYSYNNEDSAWRPASVITKSERPESTCYAAEWVIIGESRKEYENFRCTICGKCHVERGSPGCAESHDGKVQEETERQMEIEQRRTGNVMNETVVDMFHSKDSMDIDTKPPALVSSDSSVEVPAVHNRCSSFTRTQDDIKVGSRDDDENSSGCTHPGTSTLKSYRLPRLGDRRIRKLLASKHWKAAPAMLKDSMFSNNELDTKPIFCSRKISYTRQRTQRCSFKRRKLFERSFMSTSDGGLSSEVVPNSPKKRGINGEATGLSAGRASSPITFQKSSLESRNSQVKLRIKSFRVPEIFIEIPETATVGSLKRTVMEAVTAVLGSGLRVGVLLHGKKVKDDNRTLVQTGISHNDKLDSLGFTLEPTNMHPLPPQCSEDPQSLLPCDSAQPLTRFPPVAALDPGISETTPDPPVTNSQNLIESLHDSLHDTPDMPLERTAPDSKALVAIPAVSVEALAMVPLHGKSRRSELVQRRIRRPFSVSEVEALVQAVEKLGTGRWRDVKLRAFENAKHRTYVDLKDKWKTLVHTARISPQQRRGEPVPQELLDRVLAAHAYWSQQNSKTGSRTNSNAQPEPCLAPPLT